MVANADMSKPDGRGVAGVLGDGAVCMAAVYRVAVDVQGKMQCYQPLVFLELVLVYVM